MGGEIIELTKENYQEEVNNSDRPVVVDFWGPRCAPCMALLPEFEKMAASYGDQIKFCKLNSANNRRLCIELKVMALPTFLFYQGGEVVATLSGNEATKENIVAELDSLLGK
ncbi:MAG: thioredoxin family protein [bacterium]|jgi:thioredoxin 1